MRRFLGVLGLVVIVAAIVIPSTKAESQFKITPTNYDIRISNLDPITLDYEFVNSLETELDFNISIADNTYVQLLDFGIELYLIADGREVKLASSAPVTVSIAPESTEEVSIRIIPSKSESFKLKFLLEFEQVKAEQKLSQSKYSLSINLESNLAQQQFSQLEVFILVAALTLAVLICVVLLLVRLINNRSKSE